MSTEKNPEIPLLSKAVRATSTLSSSQTNLNARGVRLTIKVTRASGTGGLVVILKGTDPFTGESFPLNSEPSAVVEIGEYVYALCTPDVLGIENDVTQRTSGSLPRQWYVFVKHEDESSYAYSISCELLGGEDK